MFRKNIVRNIKNRGFIEYNQLLENNENTESFIEEIESQNMVLKDNTFVEDNVEVDD